MVLETLGLIVIIRRGENGNQEHNQDNHNDPERQSKLHWKIHLVHLQLTAFIIPNLTGKENGKSCEHIVTDFGDGFMVCVALPEKWAQTNEHTFTFFAKVEEEEGSGLYVFGQCWAIKVISCA